MAVKKKKRLEMMRGDSFFVSFELQVGDRPITPDMVSDVEVLVKDAVHRAYSCGGIGFDAEHGKWYFRPTQQETLDMEAAGYDVIACVKFANGENADVKSFPIGQILMMESHRKDVI